jgi:alkanesulfonate monooxygenase SsuD/methylene tetrahydromethanopterin reductase-like flavin-dependent oxidoreductase (luciferase family)
MKTKISVLKEHCKSIGRACKEIQYSRVLPCIIKETDQEVNQVLVQYKRKDKTLEEYLQYHVGGVAVGTPEKVVQGIKKYIGIGVTHFIRVCLFDLAKVMHEGIKGSQLVQVEKAGHGFYYEERERVNSELVRFIG